MSRILAVWRKELRDALRDGRTMIAVFVVPLVLYPGIMMLMGSWVKPSSRGFSNGSARWTESSL